MKKNMLYCILCGVLLIGVTGCGTNKNNQESKLQPNDFSGIWSSDSGNTKYYFDCNNKYKWTTHQSNFLDEKGKTFASYGSYEISENSIILDNGHKELHFLEKQNGEVDKNIICNKNECFNKSSNKTCEVLENITKEN